MKRSRPLMQDAVIAMGIIVVLLALWRLRVRHQEFGAFGSWAVTNIFGGATLSVLPGAGQEGAPVGSPVAEPVTLSSSSSSVTTNTSAPGGASETNLINTNLDVTLIADTDAPDATPSHRSNVVDAATMERRLGEVGAKGGDLQFSLFWRNINDLDLHCIDPGNEEIDFQNRISSRTKGELDVDQNAHQPFTTSPVENIYWPFDVAPPGLYRIYVVFYAERIEGGTPFTVRTVVRGRTNFFSATISHTGERERNWICTLKYDPANLDPASRYRFVRE
jgi:hypothetical protein